MSNFGFFAGGAAEGFQAQQKLGLQQRGLQLQEKQVQQQQQQAMLQQAQERINSTMKTIGDVITNASEGGLDLPEMGVFKNAIGQIETGGQANPYGTTHPPAESGDYALGRYGIMKSNLPSWSQEVLGREITEQEFLSSPEAQDAIFEAKFGQFLEQNGGSAADAASVWFTGQPLSIGGDRSDGNLTGNQYVDKFLRNVAQAPQQRLGAAVEPMLQSVEGLATAAGMDPATYRRQTEALIQSTPSSADKAIASGVAKGRERLAEAQTLMNAGIAQAEALTTAGIETADPETGTLSTDKLVELEQKLRKEFTDVSGDFITVRDAYQRIDSVYNNPTTDTGVTDVALIFNYMKMLDPQSVVRESEYATVGNAQGVPAQVRNLYNQVLSGAQIDQKTRDDMYETAGKLYEGQQTQHQRLVSQFTSIANGAGLDPANVLLDIGGVTPRDTSPDTVVGDPLGIR